jgi:hypothetical protein
MEVKRSLSDSAVIWSVRGQLDDDSILHLESMVLNSHDRSEKVLLDISGVTNLPENTMKSITHMSEHLADSGRDFEVIGAGEKLTGSLKHRNK